MTENVEAVEAELTVDDILDQAPEFHPILRVWQEILDASKKVRQERITPQWALRVVTTHADMHFQDMTDYRDLYYQSIDELAEALKVEIETDDECLKYAIDLVRATRPENKFNADVEDLIECGGSPRATQSLILGAKARAALEGRDEALPDDIRAIALPAMHHRVLTNFHAEADGVNSRDIVRMLIKDVPRPAWDVREEERKSRRSPAQFLLDLLLGKSKKRAPAKV